jgi:hypothetical protein
MGNLLIAVQDAVLTSWLSRLPDLAYPFRNPVIVWIIGKGLMDKTSSQISKKGMFAALAGTVLVALCCFTPILLVLIDAASRAGPFQR